MRTKDQTANAKDKGQASSQSLYDHEFYEAHASRASYVMLARFFSDVFRPKSAVDFGCGIGEVLRNLSVTGVEVCGLEGSKGAVEFAKIPLNIVDLSSEIDLGRRFDLAISTEVAEHLPESTADQFVDNIVKHADGAIFFTAAQPGQGGTGHINCQPKEYWETKFAMHGYRKAGLVEFVAWVALYPLIWEMPWIRRNLQVFTRKKVTLSTRALLLLPRFLTFSLYWRFRISRIGGKHQWLPKMGR